MCVFWCVLLLFVFFWWCCDLICVIFIRFYVYDWVWLCVFCVCVCCFVMLFFVYYFFLLNFVCDYFCLCVCFCVWCDNFDVCFIVCYCVVCVLCCLLFMYYEGLLWCCCVLCGGGLFYGCIVYGGGFVYGEWCVGDGGYWVDCLVCVCMWLRCVDLFVGLCGFEGLCVCDGDFVGLYMRFGVCLNMGKWGWVCIEIWGWGRRARGGGSDYGVIVKVWVMMFIGLFVVRSMFVVWLVLGNCVGLYGVLCACRAF